MTSNALPLHVAYGSVYLDWLLGNGDGSHPTNPIRAKLALEKLQERLGDQVVVVDPIPEGTAEADEQELAKVHTEAHIHAALHNHVDPQWSGARPEMSQAGFAMFRGTVRLVDAIIDGRAKVAFNPQGAKHHAYADQSSGFCVFNDMAWAALAFKEAGLKPLYLDWDIHAGDGVQAILEDTDIPTISIHNGQTFPMGTPTRDSSRTHERHEFNNPQKHFYNLNLLSGDGDQQFMAAIDRAREIIDKYKPDVILLAAGADGHEVAGNLGDLNKITYAGFEYAASMVASAAATHSQGRVLIGGAGGYRPIDHTPEVWANVTSACFLGQNRKRRNSI